MEKLDYRKAYKAQYNPSPGPHLIDLPPAVYLAVDGEGDPNTSPAYQQALEVLYALSYGIKMSKMDGTQPTGYHEYTVFPLEGLWCLKDLDDITQAFELKDKSGFLWTSMIRQPDFVTADVVESIRDKVAKKKPGLDLSLARLYRYEEGLCVQCLHLGPYDDEPATVRAMADYIAQQGYVHDFESGRRHHEIYLGDPRKTAPDKLRTVLRHPIKKA